MSALLPDILVIDSATKLGSDCRGQVLVCGSHGGEYPAFLVAKAGCRAAILNDAGIGLDEAGLSSLSYLGRFGIAAACIDTLSARIGDARDMMKRGRISRCNQTAGKLGVIPGMACAEAGELMRQAELVEVQAEPYIEARTVISGTAGEADLVLIDSASLIEPEDSGAIIVTGSHGGLVGGDPAMALQVDGLAAIFHDAGIGAARAGLMRLPALDKRGIMAATVAADSARIGDAKSIYEDGIVSHVNESAKKIGCRVGQTTREFVAVVRVGSL